MPLTAHNQAPYGDDFNTSGVDAKNYLRILFRPGYSVQARELTQLQTILQAQIDKFGRSIYVDGTPVIDGLCSFDSAVDYVDATVSNVGLLPTVTQIRRLTSDGLLTADVLDYVLISGSSYRIYVRYTKSVQTTLGENDSKFGLGDTCGYATGPDTTFEDTLFTVTALGVSAGIFVAKGVYFVKGCFVQNEAQRLFIDYAPGETLTGFAAFNVLESEVTHLDDLKLLDNANGSPNYAAPGAHRYAVELELVYVDSAEVVPENYIKLLTIGENKVPTAARTEYSNLDRILAQRTSEESGDYTLKPFMLDVREYLSDGTNRGKYPTAGMTLGEIATGETQFVVGVEPSVAYVDGYRIELNDKIDLVGTKARTFQTVEDVNFSARQGNYLEGQVLLYNDQDPTGGTKYYYSETLPDVSDSTTTYSLCTLDVSYNPVEIGTCRIRGLEHVSGSPVFYRLYIYDVRMNAGESLTDATHVLSQASAFTPGVVTNFAFLKNTASPVYETAFDTAVFELPYDTVKSIQTDGALNPEISYRVRQKFTSNDYTQVGSTVTVVLQAGSGNAFTDDTASNYVLTIKGVSPTTMLIPSSVTLSAGLNNQATVVFAYAPALTPATNVISVLANVNHINKTPRAKTLTTVTSAAKTLVGGTTGLSHSDIYEITSIMLGSVDITSEFLIDNGQRDDFYTTGRITLKKTSSVSLTASVLVSYTYFAHSGSSSYFSVDSYAGIEYTDIPSYKGVRLSDVLDFRPLISTDTAVAPVDPNSVITTNVTFYLPRTDKLVVNNTGDFSIVQGIPSTSPKVPTTPDGSLALYTLDIPAYTLKTSDIKIHYIDNKRYTMRDIGRLEKRLTNLEYYTALSLLEKDAAEKVIIDDALAIDRFKNGILVDSFNGHNVGDPENAGYACAVDTREGTLRPTYLSSNTRFGLTGALPGTLKLNTNTVTLNYTEVPLIVQKYASTTESVNPYDVAAWVGNITLSPSSDEWKSVTRTPDIMLDERGIYDSFATLAERTNVLGTVWNEWTTNWTGVIGSLVAVGSTTTTRQTNMLRAGSATTLGFTDIEKNLGERIIDVSFVPFIRTRKIYFEAKLLKPNTKVYAFLDGVDITEYATKVVTFVPFSESTDVRTYDGATSTEIDGLETPADLITEDNGSLIGFFVVPNNDELRFRTGERVFKLSDSPVNDVSATTWASEVYSAAGLLETKQSTILSTRIPQLVTNRVQDTRTIITSSTTYADPLAQTFVIGNISTGVFLTSLELYFQKASSKEIPVSIHLVSVENGIPTQNVVPFSRVTLESSAVNVRADASLPTIFTFSDPVYLQAGVEYAFVVTSNDSDYRVWVSEMSGVDVTNQGTVEAPIYEVISKNPYAGVMLKSQNASTWTPDQNRDIKFTLNRAQFNPAAPGDCTLENLIPGSVASIEITNGGSGYVTAPLVSFTAGLGSGSGAAAVAYLSGGVVAGFVITNPGTGYVVPPTITFDPPSTTAATAVLETAQFSTFNLNAQTLVLPLTRLDHYVTAGTTSYSVSPGENYDLAAEVSLTNASTFELVSSFATESEYITPVLDLDRVSILGVRNVINNVLTSEATSDLGAATARYITKQVDLNDPADQMNIYLDVNRPSTDCDISVYVKLKTDDTAFASLPWNLVAPLTTLPVSTNSKQFTEIQYKLSHSEFSSFAIKIVMTSSNPAQVPTVRNLRVIATY